MVDAMPNTISGQAIAKQVIRSGTSPSANYRAACVGKSDKDFINKLKMVEEEGIEAINARDLAKKAGISLYDDYTGFYCSDFCCSF